MKTTIRISEIFGPTIQGEGALIGRPTVFVRTGGCDYRCVWCDTLYAVLPEFKNQWTPCEPQAILDEVSRLCGGHPILVTLSGGNPALQPLGPLLDSGHARGFTFALETQGSQARPWFATLDYLTLSPKPPSSGMAAAWDGVRACLQAAGPQTCSSLKIVIFDEADYQFAREAGALFPDVPLYLQVGNAAPSQGAGEKDALLDVAALSGRLEWLLGRVAQDGWNRATILPQLHVLLWGNRRGV